MNEAKTPDHSVKTLGQGIIELFFYLPVFIIIAIYLLPASAIWAWIATLPLCYWAASLMIGRWSNLRYGVRLLLALAIGGLDGALIIGSWVKEAAILPFIVCSFAAIFIAWRGMSARMRDWSDSFPNTLMLIGVMIYVAAQPLKLLVFKKLVDYNGILIVCGIAAVILFFFIANERHLNSETIDTGRTSATLAFKRQNRLLMIIVVAIISILALFRQIQQAIERFFHAIIERIMNWLNRPKEQIITEEPPSNAAMPQMPTEEAKPPSDLMLLLEQILKVIGIAIVIAIACILLYFVFKKLYHWAKIIASRLRERGADSRKGAAGYTDEVESLMTLINLREQMGNQLKKLLPRRRTQAVEWNALASNAEKIRYLYLRVLRSGAEQGYSVNASLTPRETADDLANWKDGKLKQAGMHPFIDVYEEVRYGDKEPDNQQVDAFKRQLEKKS
jgi:hypothetical protein